MRSEAVSICLDPVAEQWAEWAGGGGSPIRRLGCGGHWNDAVAPTAAMAGDVATVEVAEEVAEAAATAAAAA